MDSIVAQGDTIEQLHIAPLRESIEAVDDAAELHSRIKADGYIYLRQFFAQTDVMAARRDILTRLQEVNEIAEPAIDGIFTGNSSRREMHPDAYKFWRSVSETWTLRRLSHGRRLHTIMDHLLGEESRVQDYLFLRPAGPGKHTNIHCDAPFFTRTTENVATAWVTLGNIPTRMGPLFIVENSHLYADVTDRFRGFDYSEENSDQASMSESPLELIKKRNCRLLTTDFTAGDVVIFGMYLLHGALDNVSTSNEVRLTCDVRYQAASAKLDPRYFGSDPTGTTGRSYGELVGAKAMTEEWHQR